MRTMSNRSRSSAFEAASGLALCLALTACSQSTSGPGATTCDGPCDAGMMATIRDLAIPPDLTGASHFRFILDSILAPDSKDNATKYLYDVDGAGTPKNTLVSVVDALNLSGAPSLQGTINNALSAGTVIELLEVSSLDPTLAYDANATVDGYAGKLPRGTNPADLYTGSATVDVDTTELPAVHTLSAVLSKTVCDTLHLPPASINIHLPLEGVEPVALTLHAARVHFRSSATMNPKGFRLVEGEPLDVDRAVLEPGVGVREVRPRLARQAQPPFGVALEVEDLTEVSEGQLLARIKNEGLQTAQVKETLARLGAVPSHDSPEEFAKFIMTQFVKWQAVAKAASIRID